MGPCCLGDGHLGFPVLWSHLRGWMVFLIGVSWWAFVAISPEYVWRSWCAGLHILKPTVDFNLEKRQNF